MSYKIIFIIFIFSKISSIQCLKINNNYNRQLSQNLSLIIENYYKTTNNNQSNLDIKEAIQLFPLSYLAYIIKGFLPDVNGSTYNISVEDYILSQKCFQDYKDDYIKGNSSTIYNMIKYSGKSYPDFGDEDGCIRKGYSFLLFYIYFNIKNEDVYEIYKQSYRLMTFISQGYSFYGLCVKNKDICKQDFIKNITNFFKGTLAKDLFRVDGFINEPNTKEVVIKNKTKENISLVLLTLFCFYILIKIIISIFGAIFFKEVDLKKNSDSSSSEEEEEEEEEEKIEEKKEDKNSVKNSQNKKEKGKVLEEKNEDDIIISNNKEIYPKFYIFYQFCSFRFAIEHLFTKQTDLYQETDLYLILLFRFISLLLYSLYMNIFSMALTPSKEINHTTFFTDFSIIFVKLSSFSSVIFILCESIIATYKLMSFIRKYTEKDKEPSFKLIFNFFLRIIPSFITTFLIFGTFYFFKEGILSLLNSSDILNKTRVQHLINNLVNCYSCVNDAKSLIPFYMHYRKYGDYFFKDKECMQFMLVMINMFYCYLFIIFIIYISYKLKNKKFDYTVIIIYIISFIIPNNISCVSSEDKILNINLLFGEFNSIKFTHLFINYYFLGFLIGLALFYNNVITEDNSFINSPIYKPFYFLEDIIEFIYLMSFNLKLIIIIISFLIQIILSVSFYIYAQNGLKNIIEYIQSEDKSNLYYKYNWFDNLIYLNEKKIFIIFFGLMLIILYTFKNESFIKGICYNMIIILFNRIGYGYYALLETTINNFYCFLQLEILLNTLNIFFITLGMIFQNFIYNIVIILLFEIPTKFITKNILQIKNKE